MFIWNIFDGNTSTLALYCSEIRFIRKWYSMDHFGAEHKEWLRCAPGVHRAPIIRRQPGGKTLYQCTRLCNAHQSSVHSDLSWHQSFWPPCPSFWTVTVLDYSNCWETTHYNFWGFFSTQGCTNLNWSHCSLNPVTNFSLHLPH